MENRQTVQFALQCLEKLEETANRTLSAHDISRAQGVPENECVDLLRRLTRAGILEECGEGKMRLQRPLEEFTALDILQALWAKETKKSTFRMLAGDSTASRLTVEYVRRTEESGEEKFNG